MPSAIFSICFSFNYISVTLVTLALVVCPNGHLQNLRCLPYCSKFCIRLDHNGRTSIVVAEISKFFLFVFCSYDISIRAAHTCRVAVILLEIYLWSNCPSILLMQRNAFALFFSHIICLGTLAQQCRRVIFLLTVIHQSVSF